MNAFSEKELYSSSLIFYSILLVPVYHNFDYVSERSYLESLLKSTKAVLSGTINFGYQ